MIYKKIFSNIKADEQNINKNNKNDDCLIDDCLDCKSMRILLFYVSFSLPFLYNSIFLH